MKEIIKGRVIKAVGGRFKVQAMSQIYNCFSRGIIKLQGEIIVGDIVDISRQGHEYIIEKVYDRVNSLIRPPIANVDNVIITIAPLPRPDFLLVDKLIVNCYKEEIYPILCYNKTDILDEELIDNIKSMYDNIIRIIYVSSLTGEGIEELKELLKGKFSCFAGQSAVGKSSIINSLAGNNMLEVGDLSRIERGRNTTRQVQLFNLPDSIMLADTCGFSSLENMDIEPEKLALYYDDYIEIGIDCKYKSCLHINEPECEVKRAVDDGRLNKERYERYKLIYQEIKERWDRRYV